MEALSVHLNWGEFKFFNIAEIRVMKFLPWHVDVFSQSHDLCQAHFAEHQSIYCLFSPKQFTPTMAVRVLNLTMDVFKRSSWQSIYDLNFCQISIRSESL